MPGGRPLRNKIMPRPGYRPFLREYRFTSFLLLQAAVFTVESFPCFVKIGGKFTFLKNYIVPIRQFPDE
jgi:hypothetical protein